MKFQISNEIIVEEPTKEVWDLYTRKLTMSNPAYLSAERAGRWTRNIPKNILLYKRDVDKLYLPYGLIDELKETIINSGYSVDLASTKPITLKGDVGLWGYQEEAVNKLVAARNGVLISPAGSGKTQIALGLIQRLGRRALWLTHTKDLVMQSMARAKKFFPEGDFGVIMDGRYELGRDITFATVQSLHNRDLAELKNAFNVVITDECHRICAKAEYIAMFYKILSALAARYKYGITATFHRSDGLEKVITYVLGDIAHMVEKSQTQTLTARLEAISTSIEESFDYLASDGTLDYSKLLKYLTTNETRNKLIADIFNSNLAHSGLILSDRLEHLSKLMALCDEPEACCMLSGKSSMKERDAAFEDMRTGAKKLLFATYSLAKEGLDIPRLSHLYLALPKKDYAVVTQSIGRIARPFEGKAEPTIYDFVDENIGYCLSTYKVRKSYYKKEGILC